MTTPGQAAETDPEVDRYVLAQHVAGLVYGVGTLTASLAAARQELAAMREAQAASHLAITTQRMQLDEILRRLPDPALAQDDRDDMPAPGNGRPGARGETADAHA